MNPAMIATWAFGLVLAGTPGIVNWKLGWIWAKLALVVGLTAFHAALARWGNAFGMDRNTHSVRFFRIVNELPTLALIGIVILVVAKPF
jgi:putative membrane protein